MKLSEFIKSTGKYDLIIFLPEVIDSVKNNKYFIKYLKRNKNIQTKAKEIVHHKNINQESESKVCTLVNINTEFDSLINDEKLYIQKKTFSNLTGYKKDKINTSIQSLFTQEEYFEL